MDIQERFFKDFETFISNYKFKQDKETSEWILDEVGNYYQFLKYRDYDSMVWGTCDIYEEWFGSYQLDDLLDMAGEEFTLFVGEYIEEIWQDAVMNLEIDFEDEDIEFIGYYRIFAYLLKEFLNQYEEEPAI